MHQGKNAVLRNTALKNSATPFWTPSISWSCPPRMEASPLISWEECRTRLSCSAHTAPVHRHATVPKICGHTSRSSHEGLLSEFKNNQHEVLLRAARREEAPSPQHGGEELGKRFYQLLLRPSSCALRVMDDGSANSTRAKCPSHWLQQCLVRHLLWSCQNEFGNSQRAVQLRPAERCIKNAPWYCRNMTIAF